MDMPEETVRKSRIIATSRVLNQNLNPNEVDQP